MKKESPSHAGKNARQISAFKKAARQLECDESEAKFDKALGKIARKSATPQKKNPRA